jgi:hypothetical protein
MEIQEVEKNVEDWLNQGFAASTKRLYRMGLKIFLDYLNETEGNGWTVERLVSERLADLEGHHFKFEQRVVDFYKWLEGYVTKSAKIPYERKDARTGKTQKAIFRMKGGRKLSDNARQAFIHAVRSFFAFHRLDLKLTKQQKRLLGKNARLVEHDYLFSIKDIEEMAKVANPQERYILLAGKDLGLRAIDFLSLKQGHFARALKQRENEEPPIFLGKIYTQKEGIYAYPFLTDDGLEAARVWLQILKSKGTYDDERPMLSIREKELTENLKRLALKAGIETHGERIRFHCLRKFLIDRVSLKMSESKWKQIVGKQIDEGAYVSPLELKEAYATVLDRIQIPKPSPLNHETMKKELEELKAEVDNLKSELAIYKDTIEALRRWPSMIKLIEQGKLLKKLGEKKLSE